MIAPSIQPFASAAPKLANVITATAAALAMVRTRSLPTYAGTNKTVLKAFLEGATVPA
jgi:hypothetical protein